MAVEISNMLDPLNLAVNTDVGKCAGRAGDEKRPTKGPLFYGKSGLFLIIFKEEIFMKLKDSQPLPVSLRKK